MGLNFSLSKVNDSLFAQTHFKEVPLFNKIAFKTIFGIM